MSTFLDWTRDRRRYIRVVVGVVAMATLVGCDKLLEVDLPGQIESTKLEDPQNAELVARSVQGLFECFYTSHTGGSSSFVDEGWLASQRARGDWGVRSIGAGGGAACPQETWNPIPSAYQSYGFGARAIRQFGQWTDAQVPNRKLLLSYIRSYTAYTLMLMAETICRGVVLEEYGPLVNNPGVLKKAEELFTAALDGADAQARNLALVGRARTRLDLGDLTGAAADAGQVTAGFSYNATYGSVPERYNRVYTEYWRDLAFTVAPARRNLKVNGVLDPRTLTVEQKKFGQDGKNLIWSVAKYNSLSSPIRLASWREAQLIIAEARLGQEAVARINALRATYNLPLYSPADVNDKSEILAAVLIERGREFFFEGGNRMNDLLRYFDADDWQHGLDSQGAPIYDMYCWPIPDREIDANPKNLNLDMNIERLPSQMNHPTRGVVPKKGWAAN